MTKMPANGLWVSDARAKVLTELVRSQGWGPKERTLCNGVLKLLADRTTFMQRMRKAILASEESKCKDAIQDMLAILDPGDDLWEGWSDAKVEALRKKL
jgi:hypothetical protein